VSAGMPFDDDDSGQNLVFQARAASCAQRQTDFSSVSSRRVGIRPEIFGSGRDTFRSLLDRRNDPVNINYQSFSGESGKGITFSDVQLASERSNPFDGGFGGRFLGEYAGNIWTRKALDAWPDTRSGVNAQNEVGGLRVH
jgi:hypothetical protein